MWHEPEERAMDARTKTLIAGALMVIALIFAIAAAAGASPSVPWSENKDTEVKLGLLKQRSRGGRDTKYSDLLGDEAKKCDRAGKAVLALVILGIIGSFFVILGIGAKVLRGLSRLFLQLGQLAVIVFFFLAWVVWIAGCHEELRNAGSGNKELMPAAGFALDFMAMILTAASFVALFFAGDFAPSSAT